VRSPGLAAVLSFFITGLGQIYNGQILKGLILILIQIINGFLTAILIGYLFLFIVWIYGLFDAYATAKRLNEREQMRAGLPRA
jgi:TM2 domain-containing membrane protein YozV